MDATSAPCLSYVHLGSGMEPNGEARGRRNWHADKALRINTDRGTILCGGCGTLTVELISA